MVRDRGACRDFGKNQSRDDEAGPAGPAAGLSANELRIDSQKLFALRAPRREFGRRHGLIDINKLVMLLRLRLRPIHDHGSRFDVRQVDGVGPHALYIVDILMKNQHPV
jgi:hypothetical protein